MAPRTNDLLVKIEGQQLGAGAVPREEMGIISPCSDCKNYLQRNNTSDPYRTPCPRRTWIETQRQDSIYVHPVLSASGSSDPNKLANPVRDVLANNYVVWIAAVDDNPGIQDQVGNIITPSILTELFDTTYIRCRPHPYVPEHDSRFFNVIGHLEESQHVWVTNNKHSSLDPIDSSKEVPIAGTVVPGTFAQKFDFTVPTDSLQTPG